MEKPQGYKHLTDSQYKKLGGARVILSSSHEKALNRKVNAGEGRKLTKKESKFKMKGWPTGPVDMKKEHKLMGKDS